MNGEKKAKRDYYHTKHAIRRLLFNQIRSWTFTPDNNFCLYKPFSLKNTIKDFLNIIRNHFFLICMSTFEVHFRKIAIFQNFFELTFYIWKRPFTHQPMKFHWWLWYFQNFSKFMNVLHILKNQIELMNVLRKFKKFWCMITKRMFVLD